MLKMMTWVSIGLSILGALVDLAHPGSPGSDDAAEVDMLATLVMGNGGAKPPTAPPASR